jgi:ribokinase
MAVTVDDVMNAREVILSADMVICQLEISMEATTFALELASQNSIPVILNPAPARNIPDGFFSKTQFITPNETETEFFTGVEIDEADLSNSAGKAVSKLLGLGAGAVVMTLGKKGAFVANERIRELMKGFAIKAVDATAAGDAFNGALAVALAEGKDIRDAVVFANGAGALAASKPGAQSSLCSRDELEEFLRACGY